MKTEPRTHIHFDYQAFTKHARTIGSSMWHGFLVTAQTTYESGAFALAFVVAGVACAFFYPTLAPPFLCTGVALFTTILVVKILDQYNFTIINSLKIKACNLSTKYTKLHLITFIFAIGVSFISPILGGAVGCAVGVGSGLIIHIERVKRLRKIHGEHVKTPKSGVKENLVFT
jgi:hypothetical protein